MKQIPLTHGQVAIVDNEDYQLVSQYSWNATFDWSIGKFYATANIKDSKGKVRMINMHRFIMDTPDGMQTDHKDRNTLDNRRKNLRICTSSQNGYNKVRYINNTSGFKGVTFHKKDKKFQAQIRVNNRYKYLGSYATAQEASIVYQQAARDLHGEFARFE